MNVSFSPDAFLNEPQVEKRRHSNSWRFHQEQTVEPTKRKTSFHAEEVSFGKLHTGLCVASLEQLVCQTIPEATGKDGSEFEGLAKRSKEGRLQADDLLYVADWLLEILDDSSSRLLSPCNVADIHSFIGLIRQNNGEHETAQRSYLSAVYIIASLQLPKHKDRLAVSLYRLGKSYGKTGNLLQMRETFDRAFGVYNNNHNKATGESS